MSYKQDNGNSASSRTALLAYKPSHSLSHNQDIDKANYNTISGANATSEKKPLLNSMNAAAESLVNNSVMGGDIQTGVSWGMAAFLLVNTALGAGMLNYPYAYNQIGGVLAASLMQVILLIFIASTMFILVYCADFNRDNTYHDVLLSMCGKRAQQISALSILITCYGINITFLIIIGDQYDRIFSSLLDPDYLQASGWFLDRKFTILATSILFIWPMCYAQRLDFLRHASVLGMFAMLYVAFLTVYEHFKLDEATIAAVTARLHTAPDQLLTATPTPAAALANSSGTVATATVATATAKQIKWFEPITVVPVLCFAYQSHEVIVPVYACMRERFIGSFMKATIFGLVILFLLYNLVGAFGYLTFGENVGADIMSLYDAQDPVVVVGIVALVIKFITTYPPLMFCGRSALDGLYGEFRKLSTDEFKSNEPTRRYVISTLWFLSTVALAVFAPDISVTLQLLGSMASINVFVFPGMCLVSLTRRLRRARQSILIGELPEGFNPHKHQMAKDYYLISGTYFNEAIKRNASLKCHHNQQQQRLNQNCALYGAASGGKCCASAPTFKAGAAAPAAAATGSNHAHVDGGDTKAKSFTATFASLIEFENNVINNGAGEGSCSNTLNGAGSSGRGTGEILSSISTTSSSSSSSSASSSQERQLTATNSSLLLNGGSSSHLSNRTTRGSGAADEQVQFRHIQRRQEEFERLVTNGSNCCVMNNHNSLSTDQQQQQQSHGPLANYNNHHSYSSCGPVCHGGNRTINDSYDDYSNCLDGCLSNGYQEHLHTNHQQHSQHLHSHPNHQHHHHHHCDNYQPYNECDKITTNPLMISHKSQQYSLSSSLRATTSSYNILKQRALANNDGTQQQLLSDKFSDSISGSGAGANYYDDNYHMADRQPGDRSTAGGANSLRPPPPHCHHCRHSNGQLSYRQQCLQNSLNYAYNQSTTGSLLDKLGSSIAPSTVAQVGISQCTATGLYLFSILLIVFGAFIFFLELANVFGFL